MDPLQTPDNPQDNSQDALPPVEFDRGVRTPLTSGADQIRIQQAAQNVAAAVQFLQRSGVSTHDMSPSFLETVWAAFRRNNTLGSVLARQWRDVHGSTDDTPVTRAQVLDAVTGAGLDQFLSYFETVRTSAELDRTMRSIQGEVEDHRILSAAGWAGLLSEIGSAVVDPINAIPVGGGLAARAASRARAAATVGAGVGATVVLQEGILQATQETRTAKESAINVAVATLLGGAVGVAIRHWHGQPAVATMQEHLAADVADGLDGAPRAISAGAAASNLLAQAGPNTSAAQAGRITRAIEGLLRRPVFGLDVRSMRNLEREVLDGQSPSTRRFGLSFFQRSRFTDGEVNVAAGLANDAAEFTQDTVYDIYHRFRGPMNDTMNTLEVLYRDNAARFDQAAAGAGLEAGWFSGTAGRTYFGQQVYRAMITGDQALHDPVVQQAARELRRTVFDPIREALIAQGRLEPGTDLRAAASYMSIIYDRRAIAGRRQEFTSFIERGFARQLENEYVTAANELRQAQIDRLTTLEAAKASKYADLAAIQTRAKASIARIEATKTRLLENFDAVTADARTPGADIAVLGRTDPRLRLRKHVEDFAAERNKIEASDLTGDKRRLALARLDAKAAKKEQPILRAIERAREKVVKEHEARVRAIRSEEAVAAQAAKDAEAALRADTPPSKRPSVMRFATPEARAKEAARLAEAFTDTVLDLKAFTPDYEISSGVGVRGFNKGRSVPVTQHELVQSGFVLDNAFDIMQRYVRTAGMDAALGTKFKRTREVVDEATGAKTTERVGDPSGSEVIKGINEDYAGQIANATGDQIEKLKQARDNEIAAVQATIRMARGQVVHSDPYFVPSHSSAFQSVSNVIKSFNYFRLMGGMMLSSIPDAAAIATANGGWGNMVRDGIMPLISNWRSVYRAANSDMRRLSRMANVATEWTMNSRVAAMAGFDDMLNPEHATSIFMRNAAHAFSNVTGMTFWNEFMKNVSYLTTQSRIIRNAERGWGRLSVRERTHMINLGMDEAMLTRIRDAHMAMPAKARTLRGASEPINFANWDQWADKEAANAFSRALDREGANGVVSPRIGDLPTWYNTPMGSLILQFRSFAIASQSRIVGRNARLAEIGGDFGKSWIGGRMGLAHAILSFSVLGGLVMYSKQVMSTNTLLGNNRDPQASSGATGKFLEDWAHKPGQMLYETWDKAGLIPILFDLNNIAARTGLPNLKDLMGVVARDRDQLGDRSARTSAFDRSLNVFGAAFGPSANALGGAVRTADLAARNIGYQLGLTQSAKSFTRAEWRNLRALIPLQNLAPVQQLMNSAEAHLANAYAWPQMK